MAGFGGSAFGRESVDPIAGIKRTPLAVRCFELDLVSELLSQLGGIRRAGNAYSSTLSQIQQLQHAASRQGPRRTVVTTLEAQGGAQVAAAAVNAVGQQSTSSNLPPSGEHVVVAASTPASLNFEDTSRYLMPT